MILLLSQGTFDYSTNAIIDYLDLFGAEYKRINGEDIISPGCLSIDMNNKIIKLNEKLIDFNEVSVVFNRRWWDKDAYFMENINTGEFDSRLSTHFISSISEEFYDLSEFLFSNMPKSATWIPRRKSVNKLVALSVAKSLGLVVPKTFILTKRSNVIDLLNKTNRIITKSISNIHELIIEKDTYTYLTKEIHMEEAEQLPDCFFPSLFQELIDKEYEIRVFYFLGDCFSMAIFSQQDDQTSVDFRNYNIEKPNRNVPYRIPEKLKFKIDDLMKRLDLNTGSIDLIKSKTGEYVFLEVNPVGQFGMVSNPNNYNLHKFVAQKLMEYDTLSKSNQ